MTDKSEWQEVNRELLAEERRRLGDPPTAEEMLAYSQGELPEQEMERIQDLLVAYPELARMFGAPAPEAPQPGDEDAMSEAELAAGWSALQRRLNAARPVTLPARAEAQRGRLQFRRYVPTSIAAALALVFFGLFVQAESRLRQPDEPFVLASPQQLHSGGTRGAGAATMLRKDGDAYLLEPQLVHQLRYAHYRIELRDENDREMWRNNTAQPDQNGVFRIMMPHAFVRSGQSYRLHIFGVDGERREPVGIYHFRVPVE